MTNTLHSQYIHLLELSLFRPVLCQQSNYMGLDRRLSSPRSSLEIFSTDQQLELFGCQFATVKYREGCAPSFKRHCCSVFSVDPFYTSYISLCNYL